MADSPSTDWINQWQALSRQGMAAWQEMAHGGATPASAAAAWPNMEQAVNSFAAQAGAPGDAAGRLLDGARSYAAFMQSMLAASAANAPGGGSGPSWNEAMRQGFAALGAEPGMFEHPAVRAWREMPGQGGSAFAQMMGALNALRAPPPDTGDLKAWLNLPAFGLLREHQEHYQKTATAWVDYQEQVRRYNALMLDASQRGFARFESKLAEHEQPGRQIESMRALYDLWVDAAEEGYAEVALSPEFREVYGALVNAQMRVRAQVQQEVERLATDLGMPTRSEINSIGERLQAVRRDLRAHGDNGALADEIAALRAEVASLKAAQGAPRRNAATDASRKRQAPAQGTRAPLHAPRTRVATKTTVPAEKAIAAPGKSRKVAARGAAKSAKPRR